MNKDRNKRIELIAFGILIAGMSVAGYVYEVNKGAVSKIVLVPSVIGLLLIFYFIYRLAIHFFVKR